jgi:hypothetical protein
MDKVLLTDLKKKMFIRSSLLALDSLNDLLGLNDYLSSDEILLEIIKKALREFENTCPLVLEMKLCRDQMSTCYGMPGFAEIKSNFTLYLDCLISEDQIILVPNATPMYRVGSTTYPGAGSYAYITEYRRPYMFIDDLPMSDQFFLRGLCARPIIPDFLPDKSFNPDSQKAAIYWMNVEDGGARSNFFMDLCMVHLLDYIRQLKASVMLPAVPVDTLSNVDPAYQELRARCDQYQLQSGWYGDLLL